MDENKSGLYIVAIVGVIAVVSMVVLVLSASARTSVVPVAAGASGTGDSTGMVAAVSDRYAQCVFDCLYLGVKAGWNKGGDALWDFCEAKPECANLAPIEKLSTPNSVILN